MALAFARLMQLRFTAEKSKSLKVAQKENWLCGRMSQADLCRKEWWMLNNSSFSKMYGWYCEADKIRCLSYGHNERPYVNGSEQCRLWLTYDNTQIFIYAHMFIFSLRVKRILRVGVSSKLSVSSERIRKTVNSIQVRTTN